MVCNVLGTVGQGFCLISTIKLIQNTFTDTVAGAGASAAGGAGAGTGLPVWAAIRVMMGEWLMESLAQWLSWRSLRPRLRSRARLFKLHEIAFLGPKKAPTKTPGAQKYSG